MCFARSLRSARWRFPCSMSSTTRGAARRSALSRIAASLHVDRLLRQQVHRRRRGNSRVDRENGAPAAVECSLMLAKIVIAFVALEHLGFLILEMFLWTKPAGRRVFGLTPERAQASKSLAANQGLYNGFLAAGLIW